MKTKTLLLIALVTALIGCASVNNTSPPVAKTPNTAELSTKTSHQIEVEKEGYQGRAPFGDGTYLVGVDVDPGIYRSHHEGSFCTWERLSGLGGQRGDIIGRNFSGGSQIVEIMPGDRAFKSVGCGKWEPVGDTIASVSFRATGAMLLSILSGVQEVFAPDVESVLELNLSVHKNMDNIRASGHISEDEEARAGEMIDQVFARILGLDSADAAGS